ncbi:hypothetical protein AGRA3207_002591 [Actinomadura graeca]|uniref:Secreted protein n=1 Tax=Actinomadura graeca TaxID=2750812 RepID=A0ABX8QSE8_9ACTN|nr:hypothetical protein [Actinomadura graeca]QXJ21710.1 hypothetical protein AGRA3207_002591 [Actinomadura graeca]
MSALRFTTKLLATAAAAATAVTLPAGAALADSDAPYARAAASVRANGTLEHGKNIVSSYKAGTGSYCVQVGSDIKLGNAVVLATPGSSRAILGVVAGPTGTCHSRTDTVTVYSWAYNAAMLDTSFHLSIP